MAFSCLFNRSRRLISSCPTLAGWKSLSHPSVNPKSKNGHLKGHTWSRHTWRSECILKKKKTQQKTYHSKKHKINSHNIVSVAARLWIYIYITKNLCVCVYLYIYIYSIYHKNVHQFAGEMRKSLSPCFHQKPLCNLQFPTLPTCNRLVDAKPVASKGSLDAPVWSAPVGMDGWNEVGNIHLVN